MEEEKYQKELFEFKKPKRFFPKLSDLFPKADFERNVLFTLTLDRVVFTAIGIIMVVVVVYAVGVEMGKERALENAQPVPQAVPQVAAKLPLKNVAAVALPAQNIKQAAPIKAPAKTAVKMPVNAPAKPYTIVAATFTHKDTAILELNRLKKQGLDASLLQSDKFFLVCVGSYADKTGPQTQSDLKKMKRMYKDAYLKLR